MHHVEAELELGKRSIIFEELIGIVIYVCLFREVFCSEEATFQRVSDAVCDPNTRPPSEETCNSLPCKPR